MVFSKGMYIKEQELHSITGKLISLPGEGLIHLQFRRFAGCPVCNLHLQQFSRRKDELDKAGIREVIVFHSTAKELKKYTADFPFDLIADPRKQLYRAYGVESSVAAILHPGVWIPIYRAVAVSLWNYLKGRQPLPAFGPEGGSLGLPADFLISPAGNILDCRYGRHANDQWTVTDVLAIAGFYL